VIPDLKLAQIAPWMVLIAGCVVVGLGLYVLIRAHRDKDSKINLSHLLLETALDPPRVTQAKAIGLGAFLASTWWITWLVVADKADSALITGYIIGWGGVKVAGDLTSIKEQESK
jgi:hypothetical protein